MQSYGTTKAADIFNDVLGPVMTGPSSSHTAGPARIGHLVHDLCGGVQSATIRYSVSGSYAATLRGQSVDRGFAAGLMGMSCDDPRLPGALALAAEGGVEIRFEAVDSRFDHPNSAIVTAVGRDGATHEVVSASTGGGNVRIERVDGMAVDLDGSRDLYVSIEPPFRLWTDPPDVLHRVLRRIVPVARDDRRTAPFRTARELLASWPPQAQLSAAALTYETALSGWTEPAILARAADLLEVMGSAAEKGQQIDGSEHFRFVLPSAGKMRAGRELFLPSGILRESTLISTAIMEHNRNMGVIVAAPTAGSAGVIPSLLLPLVRSGRVGPEQANRALLAAGLVGVFILHQGSFAAEDGGCQAENGSASAMAAAALCDLQGADARTSLRAAALALANLLGLVCDPVGGGVELPCIGRNAMAAANALVSANMVLGGFDPVIPLDEVIEAASSVARLMPAELRCTSRGGLATTPTALRLTRADLGGPGEGG